MSSSTSSTSSNSVSLPSGDHPSLEAQSAAMLIIARYYQKKVLPNDAREQLKQLINSLALDGLCLVARMFLETKQYKHANVVYNHIFTKFQYKNVPLVHIFNAATTKFYVNHVEEADLLNGKVITSLETSKLDIAFEIYASSLNYKVRLKKWDEAKKVLDLTSNQPSEKFDTNYYFNAMLTTAHLGNFDKARQDCLKVLLTTTEEENMYDIVCQKMTPERYEQIQALYTPQLNQTNNGDLPTMVITAFMSAGAGKIHDMSRYFDRAVELAKREKNDTILNSVLKFRAQVSLGMTTELLKKNSIISKVAKEDLKGLLPFKK